MAGAMCMKFGLATMAIKHAIAGSSLETKTSAALTSALFSRSNIFLSAADISLPLSFLFFFLSLALLFDFLSFLLVFFDFLFFFESFLLFLWRLESLLLLSLLLLLLLLLLLARPSSNAKRSSAELAAGAASASSGAVFCLASHALLVQVRLDDDAESVAEPEDWANPLVVITSFLFDAADVESPDRPHTEGEVLPTLSEGFLRNFM